jgi:hypothetical protein
VLHERVRLARGLSQLGYAHAKKDLTGVLSALDRNLIQDIADVCRCSGEPSEFDQALIFCSIDVTARILLSAVLNDIAKQFEIVRIDSRHGSLLDARVALAARPRRSLGVTLSLSPRALIIAMRAIISGPRLSAAASRQDIAVCP